MIYKTLVRACFELSTLYTIFVLALFTIKRDSFIIPMTFRTTAYKWGPLQNHLRASPTNLSQAGLTDIFKDWCPQTFDPLVPTPVSPQCSCIADFFVGTFVKNSEAFARGEGPADLAALGEKQAKGVVDACLGKRTTWRKETCDHFCQMHLATPVLLACLAMSLLLSRITNYQSKAWAAMAMYVPVLLALAVVVVGFIHDALGAILPTLVVLSVLFEMSFACYCMEEERVYWSFQRFFIGSLSVWAALTHQARDLYVVTSYATLGFFIGMLAYTQYVIRFRQGCNSRVRVISLYVWVGICAVAACLFLLVQQHWYPESPVWSSTVSVACLLFACAQCVVMIPGLWVPDAVQLVTGFLLLTASVISVAIDILGE